MRGLRAFALMALWCLVLPALAAGDNDRDALIEKINNLAGQTGNDAERLHKLFDYSWQWMVSEYPEMASMMGLGSGNDRWTDNSPEAIKARQEAAKIPLPVLKSIDRDKLSDDDKLNYDLFYKQVVDGIENLNYKDEYFVVTQMSGPQQNIASTMAGMPKFTEQHYRDMLSRLEKVPTLLTDAEALLRKGAEAGITPPRVTLRDVSAQFDAQIVDDPAESPLLIAFKEMPDLIPTETQNSMRKEAKAIYAKRIKPAMEAFRDYFKNEYMPKTRESIGMSALPNGQKWYAFRASTFTTTNLTPGEIHEIGLSEVKRIRAEMDKVIQSSGFEGDFKAFTEFLRTDPQFYFEKPEELLAAYRDISKRADAALVTQFGKLPRLPYGVTPVPAYAEKSQTTAYYQPGSMEMGRAGQFFANTYDLKSRPKWEMEALTLHEAVPGHHLQIALGQELEDVPMFRRFGFFTAFIEGWGLYSESLGEDMGFYKDPYSKFGQLTYEMWRAIRLVVDTGMHSKGWTRQQAIDFFKENTGKSEHDIVVEVDRYIVWPGQALAYKIGELKIKELRARAEEELGADFDVRAFHDTLLGSGAMPLDVLERNMLAWLDSQKGIDKKQAVPVP